MLKPQTTDADGKYFFGNLREGAYVVKVKPPAGYLPTVAVTDPNNNDGTDSNGYPQLPMAASSASRLTSSWVKMIDGTVAQHQHHQLVSVWLLGDAVAAHIPTLSQWGMAIMSMLLATAAFFRRRRED